MITVTDYAMGKIREVLQEESAGTVIRVKVTPG